ncbi:MAG: hypothetical protein ACO3A2_04220 [Bdellovibrionia bacterium]
MNLPDQPLGSFRVILELNAPKPRLDQVLLEKLREQTEHFDLKQISRSEFKELFKKKKIRIKKQIAHPSSSLAAGVTYVDILGFGKTSL